jgi:FtsP/CotA-like multicopper oxidase with cupredoxin domain
MTKPDRSGMAVTRRTALAGLAGVLAAPLLRPFPARADTPMTLTAAPLGPAAVDAPFKPDGLWGYNGGAPGPVLRLKQGAPAAIDFVNKLAQPSTVHWHGLRIANAMDGVPDMTQAAVPPGETFQYRFTPPDAGTYWYHSHEKSWEQVARGLYGLLVVEEAAPPRADRELAFVVDDWRVDEAGRLHEDSFGALGDWAHAGRYGNLMTVNGRRPADIPVRRGERLRLRIANTCNARILSIDFSDHVPVLIALDGQPVPPAPQATDAIVLGPGQRADVMIDMLAAEGAPARIYDVAGRQALDLGRFVYAGEPLREKPLDADMALPANPLPSGLDLGDALYAKLLMEGGAMGGMAGARFQGRQMGMRELAGHGRLWAMNGQADMAEEPLLRIPRGRTAVIDIVNDTRWPHVMHLHGHHFRVVARNGKQPATAPWRDGELMFPGERAALGFVADNPGKWLLHCHMLEHRAAGMATWVEVV